MSKPLTILYSDDNWLCLFKDSGLLTIPDRFRKELPNLHHLAQKDHGQLWVVHRLDKDTSGLVCFARNAAAHAYLSGLFQNQAVEKIYHALTKGHPLKESGTIDSPLAPDHLHKGRMQVHKKGKASLTEYQIEQGFKNYSLWRLHLITGRTHQIRVHLSSKGFPVLGDTFYGDGKSFYLSQIKPHYHTSKFQLEERPLLDRLALHASSIAFQQQDGSLLKVECPFPKDLKATLSQLNKWDHL